MSEQSVSAERITDVGYLNLRGDAQDKAFRKAAETALGQSLPLEPNTFADGDVRVLWLGPDEWLVIAGLATTADLRDGLTKELAKYHAAINDVSGGNVTFRLTGADTRNLFAKGCTLDMRIEAFGVGTCAQSGLGKANVVFALLDDAPTFDVIVRRSFHEYLLKWLSHAGAEYGIEFV